MKVLLKLSWAGTMVLFCVSASAQQNNPWSLRWHQIKTDEFKLLYPDGYERQAQRMANTLAALREPEVKTMGGRVGPITFLLQSQSAVSNGFVTMAPWRSEFFGMPPQDYNFAGTNDWLDLLAVHEYRHVVQFSRSRTGLNNAFYFLFGQQGLAVSSFLAAPQWFWEGDAVAIETAFTGSGRGRAPYFNMLLRTNLLEGQTFNYEKQNLRSFKHNISDHYVLGYHLVSYLRKKTERADVWDRVAGRAWSFPIMPFTFSSAIKKETGLYVRDLFKEMAGTLTTEWRAQIDSLELTSFESVTPRSGRAYTDYLYPQVQPDNSVVALKRGIGDVDQLVQIKDGQEKQLITLGPVQSGAQLSSEGGKVVWNELRYDPRWQLRSYVVLRTFDLQKKSVEQPTQRTRFAGSALSPAGDRIATIETTTQYETKLVVVDAKTGQRLLEVAAPAGEALAMPRWKSDTELVQLRIANGKKSIALVNLGDGNWREVTPPSTENVGHPVPVGDFILYNSPRSGIDNIYAVEPSTGKTFQITTSRYGALNPDVSPDGSWIYYNDQTKDGLDIVKIPFDPSKWKPVGAGGPADNAYTHEVTEQEGNAAVLSTIGAEQFPTKRYSRWRGLINLHSWGPYTTSSLTSVNFGIASRDVLNTTSWEAGYRFDVSERTGAWNVTASYQGFYPILDVTFSRGERSSTREVPVENGAVPITFNWTEQTIKPSVRLPLLLTRSRFNRELVVHNGVNITRVSGFTNDANGSDQRAFFDQLTNGTLLTNEFGLEFNNLMRRSRRDFNSKWGQRLEVKTIAAIAGSDFSAATGSATAYQFVPGFFKHHSVYGVAAYQWAKLTFYPDNYVLRNQIPKPRGGFSFPATEHFVFGSFNYALPLWYPDLPFGPLLYLQRVRANLFFDYGVGETNVSNASRTVASSETYRSTGVELRFDGNLIRLPGLFDVGVRYAHRLNDNQPFFEVIIGSFGF